MPIKKQKAIGSERSRRVFVAVSGGVDSSVALYLLRKQGYDVTAVFIKIGESIETPEKGEGLFVDSCWIGERRDAMRVAGVLDVPFLTFDFEKEYQREVLKYFFDEYRQGRTPNPDVMCNRKIKFSLFWKKAKALGADMMATGHYAINRNGKLYAGKDNNKDQSYFLYNLKSRDFEHILFPIGDLEKKEVRMIAKKAKLPTALKQESQGLCFVGEVNVREFLKTKIKPKKGQVVTVDKKVVGEHDGLFYYTIGQRRGLGVQGGGTAYFVVDKNFKKNELVVAPQKDEKKYYKDEVWLEDLNWINGISKLPLNCSARIRYRASLERCKVSKSKSGVKVKFSKPLRAATSGQSVVFYKDKQVVGGGIIK